VCGGEKDVAEAGENNGVEEKRMSRRLGRTIVEVVWDKREKEDEECVEVWRLCAQRQIKDLHLGQRFQGCRLQGICFIRVRFGCRGFGGAVR